MIKVSLNEVTGKTGVFIDGDWVESKDQNPQGDVRLLQLADIGDGVFLNKSNRFLTRKTAEKLRCTFLEKGDLLIARMPDPIGRACIFPGLDIPCVTVVDVCIVRPDNTIVDAEWLKFQINAASFRNKVRQYISGSTRQRISRGNLSKIKFKLPPLSQQIKIATVLIKVEALIRQRKESIDLLNELLKNTFLKMYLTNFKATQPITLNELKSGGNETFSNGPFGSDLLTSELTNEGVPVIYIRDIRNGYFKRSNNVFITKLKAVSLPNCQVKGNDLLIAKVGDPPGISAVYPNTLPSAIITQDVIRIRLNEKIANPFWINFYLNSIVGQQLLKKITIVGTRNRFSLTDFKQLEIRIPQIKIQNQFAAIVEKTETLKAQFQSSLSDLEELYASLSQRAFKGELDLSAIEMDETLLFDTQKVKPAIAIPPDLQKAIELSDKINKQFESIGKITKVTSGLTRQIEQWNKLQDQFKGITKLPEALLQAQKNMERIQEAIGKAGTTKSPVEEEIGFNWAVLANRIKERYKNRYFNFEMLHSFIQKDKLAEATPYYASEELKTNPQLNDAEDLKSFIQTAIQNIEMDEKQQRQTNPFLRLTQSFYNAEEENFTLSLHKDDFKLVKDKTARQRSGIYFSLATEA